MKENLLFKHSRIGCKIISFLLAMIMMLSFVGCKEDERKTGSSVDTSNTSSTDNNSSTPSNNDSSLDESGSNNTISIDPLTGIFTHSKNVVEKRDDADEVKPSTHSSNLYAPLIGYAESEADALRNKVLNSKNTETYYNISGIKYYISPGGNDENDGKSPQKPFRTIEALNTIVLNEGDAVLLERDSIFRITSTVMVRDGVTYGSYGTGEKPAIYASPENYANVNWKPVNKKNIWEASYIYDPVASVVINHSEIVGVQKLDVLSLRENGDFYHDTENEKVYLYCDKGNPGKTYESIEICPSLLLFQASGGTHNVVIDNLCLKYTGNYAFSTSDAVSRISITNCEIGFIGGLSQENGTRYGNAIEFWEGAVDICVENNWIYQTFDSAITWQGKSGNESKYDNISFSNNLLEYNNADIEFFDGTGASLSNFKMENNIMRFTSAGWGTRANDGGIRGIEGCIRGLTINIPNLSMVSFNNNIIDCPARQIINWVIAPGHDTGVEALNNKVYVKASYRTTNVVFAGFNNSTTDYEANAINLTQLKNAFDRFDITAELNWFN